MWLVHVWFGFLLVIPKTQQGKECIETEFDKQIEASGPEYKCSTRERGGSSKTEDDSQTEGVLKIKCDRQRVDIPKAIQAGWWSPTVQVRQAAAIETGALPYTQGVQIREAILD